MLRSLLSIIVAIILGIAVVAIIESIGHFIFPPPKDIDVTNAEHLRKIMEQIPLGALLFVLLAWVSGQFVAGFTASKIAITNKRNHALIAGSVIFLLGTFTLFIIPHPLWFPIVSILFFMPSAYLGYKVEQIIFSKT